MELHGVHHITAITGDAPANVEFYVGVLGLRMVKKTVNQDDPSVYHLFYADEKGSPGADLTFFEYPGAGRGLPGAGMVHRIVWRVGSRTRSTSGRERLPDAARDGRGGLRFADPEGSSTSCGLRRRRTRRWSPTRPTCRASTRCRASTACAPTRRDPRAAPRCCATTLGFTGGEDGRWEVARRPSAAALYVWDPAPPIQPIPGAGTVHHVAFATRREEQHDWQQRVAGSRRARPTPIIDRFYFESVYFREPNGVLFELATMGPGFATDEDPAHLGERLSLPPRFEPCASRSSRR